MAELRLRQSGIRVIAHPNPGPFVYVSVIARAAQDGTQTTIGCVGSVGLEVVAPVVLVHSGVKSHATIWSESLVVAASPSACMGQVESALADQLDMLVNDLLAANQR
jgi:hypothetical protein